MAKLQNIKAVKQLIEGSHRTQTRKKFFFDSSKVNKGSKVRKVGERWIETSPDGTKTYFEQLQGYQRRSSVHWDQRDRMDEIRQEIWSYPNCFPDCEKKKTGQYNHLDKKFQKTRGMCFDCLTKMELKLQMKGEFEDYAMQIMRENLKSWIRDQEIELGRWADSVRSGLYYANGDETIEEWKVDNAEGAINKMYEEWEEYKTILLKNYGVEEYDKQSDLDSSSNSTNR